MLLGPNSPAFAYRPAYWAKGCCEGGALNILNK